MASLLKRLLLKPAIPFAVVAKGKDREWGQMIGEAEASRIQAAQRSLMELPFFLVHKPWWMPFRVYLRLAERVAQNHFHNPMVRVFPRIQERLKGMAIGAGVRLETLCLFQMLEAACNQHTDRSGMSAPPAGGCTAIALGPGRVKEKEPVILHNLDQVEQAASCLTIRRSRAEGELSSICLTLSPLCGVVDGINEAGLSISYNYAAAVETAAHGTPLSLAISDALASCRSVPQAIQRIVQHPRNHGAMLMLGDASGCLARLELSGRFYHLEWLADPAGVLFHTNQYRSEKMEERQVRADAVYRDTCPAPLRGVRIRESSEERERALKGQLQEIDRVGIDEALELLHDHGRISCGGANTICMHGDYWSTVASVELLPRSRVFRVGYGPACQAVYRDFTF
ncbi:C45 family autoproteolytic acyltransferase/hydolase [Planctomicrobium sp. SH661]|uniref:C45 family autoproteolytic acyltransferase/hydolase n=1 Tax=Planctomicrobium sp. SH661 TaxID=3448124 RepID=UPI003F5C9A76